MNHDRLTGWKCFDKDLTCNGYKFEVGKTYEHDGEVVMCKSGFHFHHNGHQIFNYYERGSRVCEVVAHEVISDKDKSVCRKIEIVKELSLFQIMAVEHGYGNGDGDGDGDGYGDGNGYGYGYGYGNGNGYGDGYGDGYGNKNFIFGFIKKEIAA